MKKTVILLLFVFYFVMNYAFYSDKFLIGAYEISNRTYVYPPNYFNDLSGKLHEANFNDVQIPNWTHFYASPSDYGIDMSTFLANLSNYGLDANITDMYFPNTPVDTVSTGSDNIAGTEFLTSSNYFRFESEYDIPSTQFNNDLHSDKFFYRFQRELGHNNSSDIQSESNGRAWICDLPATPDTLWHTISGDMYRRWDSGDNKVMWLFKFAKNWDPALQLQYLNTNRLYIRVALKWDYSAATDTTCIDPIIRISFHGDTISGQAYANFGTKDPSTNTILHLEDLNFKPEGKYGRILKVNDFNKGDFDFQNRDSGFKVFTYSIRLDSLAIPDPRDHHTLLFNGNQMQYVIPYIEWKESRGVSIDYIEYEDDIHKAMRNNPALVDTWLYNRLSNNDNGYYSVNNQNQITYLCGIDEPNPGNYNSCGIINQHICSLWDSGRHPSLINVHRWEGENWTMGDSTTYFSNIRLFKELANPSIISVDPYPISHLTEFNRKADDNFVQKSIDRTCDDYRIVKESGTPFIAIPQSFGDWDPDTNTWWGRMYPTKVTQKCLQYLPLCYGPTGIIDFALMHGNPNIVTPLWYYNNQMYSDSNYVALKKANAKIKIYGPIVKESQWKGAQCLKIDSTYTDFSIAGHPANYHFFNMSIPYFPYQNENQAYHGYIHCGYYFNTMTNDYYYMLVNRRTDKYFSLIPASSMPNASYADYYTVYDPQILKFNVSPNSALNNLYGSKQGLYDPATNNLQVADTDGSINIVLGPGEASLRKIVAVLPEYISTNYTSPRNVYVADSVVVHRTNFTIPVNDTLFIMPHTKLVLEHGAHASFHGSVVIGEGGEIVVNDGSSLNVFGTVNASLGSRIFVESEGLLFLQSASCIMSDSSLISVNNAEALIDSTTFNTSTNIPWEGISVIGSNIQLRHSTINNAKTALTLSQSRLQMANSTILIPQDSTGILITNAGSSDIIEFAGDDSHPNLITSMNNAVGKNGIRLSSTTNPFLCKWTNFSNLKTGIEYCLSAVKTDSIAHCVFTNCDKGIDISGSGGLSSVNNCIFNISIAGTGIASTIYIPIIRECLFTSSLYNPDNPTNKGIYLDFANELTKAKIYNCIFTGLKTGIESRESTVGIRECNFDHNKYGLMNHKQAFVDCSNNAKNVFQNLRSNVIFLPDTPLPSVSHFYTSVELIQGHNDFYHRPGSIYDFLIEMHYDYYTAGKILASGNFWGRDSLSVDSTAVLQSGAHQIFDCSNWDTSPNSSLYSFIPVTRFEQAIAYDQAENYDQAFILYKQILSDRLIDEKDYWELCVPHIYSIAKDSNLNLEDLITYYDEEISMTPTDDSLGLKRLMKAYEAYVYINEKDYQSAADIIKDRIDNPISESDSLEAVMDMEILYMLRDNEGSKKPLITNLTQYHYPNFQTFKIKHEENYQKLLMLYSGLEDIGTPLVIMNLSLGNNYPNPFNPSTTIEYSVPKTTKVKLRIYNIRGQLVKELVNQTVEPGKYKVVWEGKNNAGHSVASGVYFYRIEANGKTITKKMLMLK